MAMQDAPAISLPSEDPGDADLEERLHRTPRDLEAHFLKLYNVTEVSLDMRRNSFDRHRPIGVLRTRPVQSWPDLVSTSLTPPAEDAKERGIGGPRPEGLERLRPTSK
jgi:hypothetical protein